MNAEEIDELFNAYDEGNLDKVLELAEIEKNGTARETIIEIGEEKTVELIMQKIEQGDFEYFFSKKDSVDSDSIFYTLMQYSSKTDCIKELISEKKETLRPYQIRDLVIATKDSEYIEEYIESHKSEFSHRVVTELVKETGDSNYIKSFIEKQVGNESSRISGTDIASLIIATKDIEYIKGIIADKKQQEILGLDNVDKINLIASTNDPEYMESEFEKPEYGISSLDDGDPNKKIKLPSDMTIGIEIESEGKSSEYIKKMTDVIGRRWTCKEDGSLGDGVEVVSPILSGTNERTTKSVKRVCKSLEILGQSTSSRCGGHVHIGANYLKSKESWQNLIEIVGNTEEILYAISNAKGEKPRKGIGTYAGPISGNIEKLAAGEVNFETKEDLKLFAKTVQGGDGYKNRYYGVNFLNLGNKKGTIEFRLSNGTIDENTWIENINLYGGIVKAAEDLAQIQAKPEEQRSEAEKKKIACLEQLKEEVSPEDKLDALLELTIPEEDRDVYRERYDVNHKLIEEDKGLKGGITGKTAKKPIVINKNKVGRAVFTGEKAVTGQDYEKGVEMLKRDLDRGTFDRDSA